MPSDIKVGDLVILSDFGIAISSEQYIMGIIISGPYNMTAPIGSTPEVYFIAYDVLVGEELFKRVPAEFLKRMIREEDIK